MLLTIYNRLNLNSRDNRSHLINVMYELATPYKIVTDYYNSKRLSFLTVLHALYVTDFCRSINVYLESYEYFNKHRSGLDLEMNPD